MDYPTPGGDMKPKEMDRREFLKKSAGCVTFAALGMTAPVLLKGTSLADRIPDLVVADGEPGPATRAAVLAMGGMGRYVKKGARVVIKPNMSFANPPEAATTTHPAVVRELALLCREAGASSVLVLDNPLRKAELCLERSGLRKVCEGIPDTRVEGIEHSRFFQETKIPEGRELKTTSVMKAVLEADVLIAAPVAKSHSATGVSLAMKGMMGLIYNRSEMHTNMDLNTAIVDLCTILRPALTVIDASRILSDSGPGGPGKVIALHKILASTDMVAADAMAVELGTWYGRPFKAHQVKHIKLAHERGLGNMELSTQVVQEVSAG
jgi:uncharacterized protein (DUF362 family)